MSTTATTTETTEFKDVWDIVDGKGPVAAAPKPKTETPAKKAPAAKAKAPVKKKADPKVIPNAKLTETEREDFEKAEAKVKAPKAPAPKKTTKEFTLTHRENCVLVTIGGNKVKWTSADGRLFSFTFFDDGCVEGSSTWGGVIIDEMADFGIATKRGGAAVLVSLQKKGLLERGEVHEDGKDSAWILTKLGADVALALNEKDWK